jgi:glutamate-1-semialdehyde 2,1-aminomutase
MMDAVAGLEERSALVARARRVLPGGTFGNFPAEIILREGRGGRVWDVAGREYVDFLPRKIHEACSGPVSA